MTEGIKYYDELFGHEENGSSQWVKEDGAWKYRGLTADEIKSIQKLLDEWELEKKNRELTE